MKNNVIGSRQTMMNSLNKMAPRPRKGRDFIAKLQAPNPKEAPMAKHQPVDWIFEDWDLGISWGLEIGVWCFAVHAAFFSSAAYLADNVTKTSSSDGPISWISA